MLANNQVIQWNNQDYRILLMRGEDVFLFPMLHNKVSYEVHSSDTVLSAFKAGEIKLIEDRYLALRHQCPPKEKRSREKQEENYSLIKPIVEYPQIYFNKKLRHQKIKEIAKNKSEERKIYRLLNCWMLKGQAPNALLPEYTNVNHTVTKPKVKVGRKGASEVEAPAIDEKSYEIFDKICRQHVLIPGGVSLRGGYLRYLREHQQTNDGPAHSYAQFRYFFYTRYTPRERAELRATEIAFKKDIRALTGSVFDIVHGIGERYEVDSTLADVYLVSETDRSQVIGRPTLYGVVDTFSGMLVGLSVSLDQPQYKTAADVLYVAFTDKVQYCKKFGIEITPEEWPAQGIPRLITADNAELQGEQIENFMNAHGIGVDNTTPYGAEQKGTVERTLGLLMNEVKYRLPGVPDKRKLRKEGAKDTRTEATLTLKEYTKALLLSVRTINRRVRECVAPGLPANVANTPIDIWRWAAQARRTFFKAQEEPQTLRLSLLPRYTVTFSREGINAQGIRYLCKEALDMGYIDRAQRGNRPQHMKMAIDPSDVSVAYLYPDAQRKPFDYWVCRLAPTSEHLNAMTLGEAKHLMELRKTADGKARELLQMLQVEKIGSVDNVIETALAQKPQDSRTKREIVREIAENRRKEQYTQEHNAPRVPVTEHRSCEKADESKAKAKSERKHYPTRLEDLPD